ncbi:MAG: 3-methyladenine glycosylase [Gammaproteobacteria bacterium]|jgi:DNA-3-methyladenine glycosylase|nr:3-methyladenine glycosylase [Gammaproteobacteria bacterium]
MKKLSREFYDRDTVIVAKELLGKYLIHEDRIGKIVEVEAYVGTHDLASHSAKGLTKRTQIMFGSAGYAYVYMIYGLYYCMNIVTEGEGQASAVLIRAIEPIKNIHDRTQGPGLVCKAMHINKSLNGHDLCSDYFYLADAQQSEEFIILEKPRIGVPYAGEWANKLLRFYIQGNAFVSRKEK